MYVLVSVVHDQPATLALISVAADKVIIGGEMDRFGREVEVLDASLDRGFDGLGVKMDLLGKKVEAKVEGLGQDDSSLGTIVH